MESDRDPRSLGREGPRLAPRALRQRQLEPGGRVVNRVPAGDLERDRRRAGPDAETGVPLVLLLPVRDVLADADWTVALQLRLRVFAHGDGARTVLGERDAVVIRQRRPIANPRLADLADDFAGEVGVVK